MAKLIVLQLSQYYCKFLYNEDNVIKEAPFEDYNFRSQYLSKYLVSPHETVRPYNT